MTEYVPFHHISKSQAMGPFLCFIHCDRFQLDNHLSSRLGNYMYLIICVWRSPMEKVKNVASELGPKSWLSRVISKVKGRMVVE